MTWRFLGWNTEIVFFLRNLVVNAGDIGTWLLKPAEQCLRPAQRKLTKRWAKFEGIEAREDDAPRVI